MAENPSEPSLPAHKRGGGRKATTFDQERVVRRYLSAVEVARPGRGTKRTADAIGNRITKVDELLVSADPLRRVHLTQERIELHAEYVRISNGNSGDLSQLERDFVRVVRSYGDRNGITYAAWRQVGVDPKVLERGGVHKAEKKPPPAAVRAAEVEAGTNGARPAREEPAREQPARAEEPARAEQPAGEGVSGSRDPAPAGGAPTEAVSMEELAALLADASAGSAATASSSQPTLGDEMGATRDDARSPADPGRATDDRNGA